jgi:nucleotide-binding universal stress UspA family protein
MTRKTLAKGMSCIVMPTDFQPAARRAFMLGLKLAAALDARLQIVHVIKTLSDPAGAVIGSAYLKSRKTSALLELGRLTRVAREAGVQAEPLLFYGVPPACILDAVKQARAKMIVMGTEGRTGWDRLRLGSTAQAIVREAPCPVLTVHGGLAGDMARRPARVRIGRLLVATDFSGYAEAALHVACELAARVNARLCLVHATGTAAAPESGQRRLLRLVNDLRQQGLEAEGRCIPGDPVETILAQATVWQPDLIAVGTHGRRGLNRVLLGSVAEALLGRAGCPVLTVGTILRQAKGNHT